MPANDPNTAEWIMAVSGVFAAVGTVGAVIVALAQSRGQTRRSVTVDGSMAVTDLGLGPVHMYVIRATNTGWRPVKIVSAALLSNDGRTVVSPPIGGIGEALPKVLADGESVEYFFDADKLERAKAENGFTAYRAAFFRDTLGNVYATAFPGATAVRRWERAGLRFRRDTRYRLRSEARSDCWPPTDPDVYAAAKRAERRATTRLDTPQAVGRLPARRRA